MDGLESGARLGGMPLIRERFADKVAIVTGGASGMGRAQAIRLAAEGARVAIIDIDREGADETRSIASQAHDDVAVFATDVTDAAQVEQSLKEVRDRFGPVDLLFNNAGTVLVKPYTETTEDEFDGLMNVNLRSAFMVTKRVTAQMVENGGGSIVIMSSVSSMRGFDLEAIYGASKAAVQSLMQTIAIEFRERGIRCNAICPAFVRTKHGTREIEAFEELGFDWGEAQLKETQLRICEPEEVASVALYLASDEARAVNGVAVPIDNGWMSKG